MINTTCIDYETNLFKERIMSKNETKNTNAKTNTNTKKMSVEQKQKQFDACATYDLKKQFIIELQKRSIRFDDIKINVNNELTTITKHRNDLIQRLQKSNIAKTSSKSKSIRNQLRKTCFHYGAMRQRTFTNKLSNERIIMNA